jgi:hypothetical protein
MAPDEIGDVKEKMFWRGLFMKWGIPFTTVFDVIN